MTWILDRDMGFPGETREFGVGLSAMLGCNSTLSARFWDAGCGFRCRLEDGEEGGQEGDLDAGDGGEAEEAVFDLGDELGVGVVGA